jgi:hypothetical protein
MSLLKVVLMVSMNVLMVPAYLITGNVMAGVTAQILVMKPVADQKPAVTVNMTLLLMAVNVVTQQPMRLV